MTVPNAPAPMHHPGGETATDANFVQRFIDSDLGVFTGSLLHTGGALLFTAGIIAYVMVAHRLRKTTGDRGQWLAILPFAHWFTVSGIVLNGGGGLMRLYQSDHPGIEQAGSSLWVQVLVVKHVFLVLGVGLALWVTWRTQVPEPEMSPLPELGMSPTRISLFAITSFITIVLATVLGAVAGTTPIAPADDMEDTMAGESGGLLVNETFVTYRAGGTVSGTPLMAGEVDAMRFTVLNGTKQVTVELSWTQAAASLDLRVEDEAGQPIDGNKTAVGDTGMEFVADGPNVRPGEWTIVVTAETAVSETFDLRTVLRLVDEDIELLTDTVVLAPTTTIFEINLEMPYNGTMRYSWEVLNDDTSEIYFDVHTHRGGEVQTPVQGYWNSLTGDWTQDSEDDEGVSLMWAPEDSDENRYSEEIRLKYRVEGPFHVHSIVGP